MPQPNPYEYASPVPAEVLSTSTLSFDENWDENDEENVPVEKKSNDKHYSKECDIEVLNKNRKFHNKMKKKFLKKLEENSESLDQLTFVHINARSAACELEEVEALGVFAEAHILCITESWFAEDVKYTLKGFENFVSMSSNREGWTHGGSVIFVRRDIVDNFKPLKITYKTSMESQIVGIQSTKFNLCIFCCYRSPSQSHSEVTKFLDDVEKLQLENIDEFIFLGDLNMRTAYGPGHVKNDYKVTGPYKRIYDYFESLDVDQPITEATHKDGNTLDIFWCSCFIDIFKSGVYSDYEFNSDHLPIHLTINLGKSLTKKAIGETRQVTDWSRVDFDGYRKELLQKQNRLCGMANMVRDGKMDVDLSATTLNNEIIAIWDKHAPKIWIEIDNKAFSTETRKQISKLQEVSKYNHRRSEVVRKESKLLSELIKDDKKAKSEKRLQKIVSERQSIYAFFKDARRGENRVGPFTDPTTGKLSESNEEMVKMLSTHYKSVWNKNSKITVDSTTRPSWWHPPLDHNFDYEGHVEVSEHDLRVAMKTVKRRVGIGSDGLTGWMIKEAIEPLLLPLLLLLKNMIYWGVWPSIYKLADVRSLRKGGASDDMNNTRPISLTALIGKIFEKVLMEKFVNHIKFFAKGRFNIKQNQYGFYKGRCVQDNLTMKINKISCILEAQESADVIYLDIRKGFDSVCFQNLAEDLRDAGLFGKIFNLWKSWMSDRKQRVKIDNTFSEYVDVTGSTPQGTSAGPVFFINYLNEAIPDDIGVNGKLKKHNSEDERLSETPRTKRRRIVNTTSVFSYADDSVICGSSKNHKDIQEAINNFQNWAVKKKMAFNVKKTLCLRIGKNNPGIKYYMDGEEIATADSVRDLGLFYSFDEKKNRICYDETVRKRLKDCRVVLKLSRNIISSRRNTIDHFIHAYQTYVFPLLYTFSEFYFFETQEECNIVDDVFKAFFSNLDFVFSDLKSFPYAPSAILKKMSRIRFWRIARSMTGCDPFDLFDFIGSEEVIDKDGKKVKGNIRDRIRYPAMIPDYKRPDCRLDALQRNLCWRLIPWWNTRVPHHEIDSRWDRFKQWIETDAYVLHELHTKESLELRNKIMSGHFSDIRKRKSRHIQDSKRNAAEEIERKLNEACNRARVPITPMRTDFGNYLTISKDAKKCIVRSPDGAGFETKLCGLVTPGGARAQNHNKTTAADAKEGAQEASISPPSCPKERQRLQVLNFPYLEEFEDGTVEESSRDGSEVEVREEKASYDNDQLRVLCNQVPGRRIRSRRRRGPGADSNSEDADREEERQNYYHY